MNRLGRFGGAVFVGVFIGGAAGFIVMTGVEIFNSLSEPTMMREAFNVKLASVAYIGCIAAIYGVLVGGPIAALVVYLLVEGNPWRAFPLLTAGAAGGLALQITLMNLFFPPGRDPTNGSLFFIPIGPTIGGVLAAILRRQVTRRSA